MPRTERSKSSILILLFGIILSYFIVSERWIGKKGDAWRGIIDSDARGYYAYLPAVFIYQDLYFDFVKREEAKVFGTGKAEYPYLMSGQRGNRYFIGTAIILSPFFFLAWLISWLTGNSLNGYNEIFFCSVSVAALFYMLAGLIFIRKYLRLYNIKEGWISLILLMLTFGTNTLHYIIYEPGVSHVYSFFLISVFIYLLKAFQLDNKKNRLIWMSVILALIGLVRPVNGVIVFAVPFLLGSLNDVKIFFRNILDRKKLLSPIIIFLAIVSLQPLILYLTYGDFFRYPYRGESFYFFDGHFWDALFSYKKGLFIYTPFIFLSVISSFAFVKRSPFATVSYILFFLILNSIISGWGTWYYGGSFGHRAFIEFFPLFIIPLSILLNELKLNFIKGLCLFIVLLTLFLNGIQMYQYENGIIHFANMDKDKYWKVFLRTDKKYHVVAYAADAYSIPMDEVILKSVIDFDFEGEKWNSVSSVTNEDSYSSSHSVKIAKPIIYSPGYDTKCSTLMENKLTHVRVKVMVKTISSGNETRLVASIEKPDGYIYKYTSSDIGLLADVPNKWTPLSFDMELPKMDPDDLFKIYAWNETDSPIFIDDMKIEFYAKK